MPTRLNQRKYCKREYGKPFGLSSKKRVNNNFAAIEILVVKKEAVDSNVLYTVEVESVFKRSNDVRIRRGQQSFWMTEEEFNCKCPKLKLGKRYLLLGRGGTNDVDRPGIVNNRFTMVIDWDDSYLDKLERFSRRELKGQCDYRQKTRSHE